MEVDSVAKIAAECLQAPKADLPSLATWRYPYRPPTAAALVIFSKRPDAGHPSRYPGQLAGFTGAGIETGKDACNPHN